MKITFMEKALEDGYSSREIMSLMSAVDAEAWSNCDGDGVIPMLVETDYSQAFGFIPNSLFNKVKFDEDELCCFVQNIIGDMNNETPSGIYSFGDEVVIIKRDLE